MQWLPFILLTPYLFLLLKIYRSLLKIRTVVTIDNPVTFISVVVACRNEEEKLPLLLKNISGQNYSKKLFEIIIVDDHSTDKTFEIASSFKESERVIVLKNSGAGKKSALRTGILASSGQLIITTDADCTMSGSWLTSIASFFENNRPDMIICPVQLRPEDGFFGRFQEIEFMSLQGITAGTALAGEPVMCNGANLAFTREAYLRNVENLRFDIASGDDVFLLHSLKKEKLSKILWLESACAIVTTIPSRTIAQFLRQRSRWISKGKYYTDRATTTLAITSLIAICMQLTLIIATLINPSLIWILATFLILKSFPDYLIISNTAVRYGRKGILRWFMPAQLVYPFYIIGVALYSLISKNDIIPNYPSLKGT